MAWNRCLTIFKDPTLTAEARHLLSGFQDPEKISKNTVLAAIRVILSGELDLQDRVKVYEVVNAASTFSAPVAKVWKAQLKLHQILPSSLVQVWLELYPTLEPEDFMILNYQHFIFYERQSIIHVYPVECPILFGCRLG